MQQRRRRFTLSPHVKRSLKIESFRWLFYLGVPIFVFHYATYENVEWFRRTFGLDGFLRTTMSGELPSHSTIVAREREIREERMKKRDLMIAQRLEMFRRELEETPAEDSIAAEKAQTTVINQEQ